MPNRILRDWTDSFKIDELTIQGERFFTRLIMKVDDYGRFSSDCRLLKANLFPLKPDVRETDITRWLAECEKAGLIVLYSVAMKGYLQITDFKQQLRQKTEKYPSPDQCSADAKQMHSRCVADANVKRNEVETETETETKKRAAPPKILENPFSPEFLPLWQDWKDYKREEHKFRYKTEKSEQAALNSLVKLSGGDEATAKEIILQSMANGWQGFFELKTTRNATGTTPRATAPGRDSIFNPYSENFIGKR